MFVIKLLWLFHDVGIVVLLGWYHVSIVSRYNVSMVYTIIENICRLPVFTMQEHGVLLFDPLRYPRSLLLFP